MQTQTTAPASTLLHPYSPAVAKAIHKLQEAILNERLSAPVAPPGAIVLSAVAKFSDFDYSDDLNHRVLQLRDSVGNEWRVQAPYEITRDYQRHDRWYGSETRVDGDGNRWQRTLRGDFIMDDFGFLVQVPEL